MRLEDILKKYFNFLERKGRMFNIVVGLICTAFLGIVDYLTVEDFNLTLFYFVPTSFAAWFAGRNAGIALALVSTLYWMVANNYTAINFISMWNVATSLGSFITVAMLLSKLRQMFDNEQNLSQTDHLTGILNRRAFLQILTKEILRQGRNNQPLTLAYFDLDNFKDINDNFGHSKGDYILQLVTSTFTQTLRKTDIIARLGGDEFAILLPDMDQLAAQEVIPILQEHFRNKTNQHKLEVSLSIGVLTCLEPPATADEMITLADSLMYEVKKNGKNGVRYAVYHEQLSFDLQ
jgi:diguanylate cyclase (GGDEF)-like protein